MLLAPWLQREATGYKESIPWNRCLGSLKVKKFGLSAGTRMSSKLHMMWISPQQLGGGGDSSRCRRHVAVKYIISINIYSMYLKKQLLSFAKRKNTVHSTIFVFIVYLVKIVSQVIKFRFKWKSLTRYSPIRALKSPNVSRIIFNLTSRFFLLG